MQFIEKLEQAKQKKQNFLSFFLSFTCAAAWRNRDGCI